MLKLRKMLQWVDDLELVCLQRLMAFTLCRVSHEERCRESANLPLFRTICLDGPWEMLTHATAWLCFFLLFSSRSKLNQEKTFLVLINQPWRKITCKHCLQQWDFQQMVVAAGLAFSVKWPQNNHGKKINCKNE